MSSTICENFSEVSLGSSVDYEEMHDVSRVECASQVDVASIYARVCTEDGDEDGDEDEVTSRYVPYVSNCASSCASSCASNSMETEDLDDDAHSHN